MVRPITPNFRRFVSPGDPGNVVVPSVSRRRKPRREPPEGAKPLNVSNEKPEGDWMARRTLHHYPREALGRRFGIGAFMVMCALVLTLVGNSFLFESDLISDWLPALTVLSLLVTNVMGIFSQVLTGGRSWHGAVALAAVWICALFVMILAGR